MASRFIRAQGPLKDLRVCIHHIAKHLHTHTRTSTHGHTYTHRRTHMCATHTHTHTHAQKHVNTRAQANCMHPHTQTQPPPPPPGKLNEMAPPQWTGSRGDGSYSRQHLCFRRRPTQQKHVRSREVERDGNACFRSYQSARVSAIACTLQVHGMARRNELSLKRHCSFRLSFFFWGGGEGGTCPRLSLVFVVVVVCLFFLQ